MKLLSLGGEDHHYTFEASLLYDWRMFSLGLGTAWFKSVKQFALMIGPCRLYVEYRTHWISQYNQS